MPPPTVSQPLHSILLVIKTRSGPRLVLHYPPSPDEGIRQRSLHSAYSDESLSDAADRNQEDAALPTSYNALNNSSRPFPSIPAFSSSDSLSRSSSHEDDSGLEFGSASADSMARLLAPASRKWNKKRFELTIEDRTYLACPMFEREDSGWSKKKEKKKGDKQKALKDTQAIASRGQEDSQGHEHDLDNLQDDGDDNDATGDSSNGGRKDSTASWDRLDSGEDGAEATDTTKGATDHKDWGDGGTGSGVEDDAVTVTGSTRSIRIPARPKQDDNTRLSSGHELAPASFATNTTGTSGSARSQTSSMEGQMPQTLTMFSLVFVLQDHIEMEDAEDTVQQIYSHVVKKLTKALKWIQKRHGWLWAQCRSVLCIRERGKEQGQVSYKNLWPTIAAKSSLARALAAAFDCIKAGEIAHLSFGPSRSPLRVSLQIPLIMTTAYASTPAEPQKPGLFTTSYDPYAIDELDAYEDNGALAPHCAILLLTPPADLLRELAAQASNSSTSTMLIQYVRHSMPTKTLMQLSKRSRLSLRIIQALSAHLIHWRHAIAIPPLHQSHYYVPNPNADFSRIEEARDAYAKRFPLLPSLTAMLGKLSGHGTVVLASGKTATGPQPYATFIPSSDHKEPYMEVLEWMLRDGWLTHLRTFAWVQITPAVKAAVARQIRSEQKAEDEAAERAEVESELERSAEAAAMSDDEQLPSEAAIARDRKRSSGGSVAVPVQSPQLRAILGQGKPRPGSEADSSSSAKTTVRISSGLRVPSQASRGRSSRSRSNHSKRPSEDSSQAQSGGLSKATSRESNPIGAEPGEDDAGEEEEEENIKEEDFEPSIVLSPHRANAFESRWLKHVGESLPTEELRSRWPKLVRYFDGKHALEEIALRQGWKRKTVLPLLQRLMNEEEGVLRVVRHW